MTQRIPWGAGSLFNVSRGEIITGAWQFVNDHHERILRSTYSHIVEATPIDLIANLALPTSTQLRIVDAPAYAIPQTMNESDSYRTVGLARPSSRPEPHTGAL